MNNPWILTLLIGAMASPMVVDAMPSVRQRVRSEIKKLPAKIKERAVEELHTKRDFSVVDLNRSTTVGDATVSGQFGVNVYGKVLQPNELTPLQSQQSGKRFFRVGGTMSFGGSAAIPIGPVSLRPALGSRAVYAMTNGVETRRVNQALRGELNSAEQITRLLRAAGQDAFEGRGAFVPVTSIDGVQDSLAVGGKVTFLLEGSVGLSAGVGRSVSVDSSYGRAGASIGFNAGVSGKGIYSVTVERRSDSQAHVLIAKVKESTVRAALGLQTNARVDFSELFPAFTNSYLDKAAGRGEGEVQSRVQKIVDYANLRANATFSARTKSEKRSGYTLDLNRKEELARAEVDTLNEQRDFNFGVKVKEITLASRIAHSSGDEGRIELNDDSVIKWRAGTVRKGQDGVLSNSPWFAFSRGARQSNERHVIVEKEGASQKAEFMVGTYRTNDKKTSRKERKAYRALAEVFGADASEARRSDNNKTQRTLAYEIDEAGLQKIRSFVRGGRLNAEGRAVLIDAMSKVAQKVEGVSGRLPFDNSEAVEALAQSDYDSAVDHQTNVHANYQRDTNGRNLNTDKPLYQQYARVVELVETFGRSSIETPSPLANTYMPLNEFGVRAALLTALAGIDNSNVKMKLLEKDGSEAFSFERNSTKVNRVNPRNLADRALYNPEIVDFDF